MSVISAPMLMHPPVAPQDTGDAPAFLWPSNFTEDDFTKLKASVKNAYKHLETHRQARYAWIQQWVGSSYSGGSDLPITTSDTVVNMLATMVRTYCQQLVSGNPQTLIITQKSALKTAARYFEIALNHVIHNIDLQASGEYGVIESMFSMGVMKVGVDLPEHSDRAYPFDASAIPFAQAVFFDDFVFDTTVNRWELIGFCGDRYKELKDVVKSDERNNPEVIAELDSAGTTSAFDSQGPHNAENLSGQQTVYEMDAKEYVRLWDVWLPKKRLVVTYCEEGPDKPLRISKWTGPPRGPYYPLAYEAVLNNIFPRPPIGDIAPMSELENELVNKMGEQASRQKTITFATMSGDRDAKTIINASDGETVHVQNPEAVREAKFGGIAQESMVFAQWLNGRASEEAGNLKSMSGSAPGADTLGQEELMKASSSARIQWYQQKVVKWMTDIVTAIGWYIWNDPLVRVSVLDKIPGTDVELEVQWPIQRDEYGNEVDMRQGELNDFNFTICPFSLAPQSPQQRLAKINAFVQQIMPLMPMAQQQGVSIDLQELVRINARYMDTPELLEILTCSAPVPDPEEQPVNTSAPKPAVTTRQYDRVVKPGGNPMDKLVSSLPGTDTKPAMGGAA